MSFKEKKKFEVILFGRGGQGVKTSAEILAQGALAEGKFVQAFPEFGPERSGAPVKAFVRISDEPILTHEPVVDPDTVLVLDESVILSAGATKNLTGKEPLIVNTRKDKNQIAKEIKFSGLIVPIDASGIAKEIIGEERPNVAILGKFSFITEKIKLDSLKKAFKNKYQGKIPNDRLEKNLLAMEKAFFQIS